MESKDLRALSREELADKLEHIPVASGYAFEVAVNVCRRLREDGGLIAEMQAYVTKTAVDKRDLEAQLARWQEWAVGVLATPKCDDDGRDDDWLMDAIGDIASSKAQLAANSKGDAIKVGDRVRYASCKGSSGIGRVLQVDPPNHASSYPYLIQREDGGGEWMGDDEIVERLPPGNSKGDVLALESTVAHKFYKELGHGTVANIGKLGGDPHPYLVQFANRTEPMWCGLAELTRLPPEPAVRKPPFVWSDEDIVRLVPGASVLVELPGDGMQRRTVQYVMGNGIVLHGYSCNLSKCDPQSLITPEPAKPVDATSVAPLDEHVLREKLAEGRALRKHYEKHGSLPPKPVEPTADSKPAATGERRYGLHDTQVTLTELINDYEPGVPGHQAFLHLQSVLAGVERVAAEMEPHCTAQDTFARLHRQWAAKLRRL